MRLPLPRNCLLTCTPHTEGYADDTYMLTVTPLSLLAMLVATRWLQLTGQEINAKKSLAFSATNSARGKPEALEATLDGVRMPVQQEFRQLGVRTVPRRGMGPLLHRRIKEGKTALKKTRMLPGGFDRKAAVAAVMIVAAALFGVELADLSLRDISSLESAIMTVILGPSRPCRAKEVVFALLLPGHHAQPRHGADGNTGHLGAHDIAQGNGPAGASALGISQAGLAEPGWVVAVGHAAHGGEGAPGACRQGIRGAPVSRVPQGSPTGSAGKTEAVHLRRNGSTSTSRANTQRTELVHGGTRQVTA